MQKGQVFQGEVQGLDGEGRGWWVEGGARLLVAGAAPGDVVRAEVEHVSPHKPVAWGRVVEVVSRGPHFVEPACPHAWPVRGRCGGCPLMHLGEEAQGRVKGIVGGGSFLGAHAPPSPRILGYRARGHFVAGRGEGGEVVLGSFAPGSHELARMDGCLVVRPDVERVAREVERAARGVPVWPEAGGLRYVTVRASSQGECLVELIAGAVDAPWVAALAAALGEVAGVVGVSASANASQGNAMRVAAPSVVWGRERVLEEVGPLRLEMRADTFSQLHLEVAARMYERAAQWAWEGAADSAGVVWDLYCGLGGLGLRVALGREGAQVWGAEAVEGSLDLARSNAERAGVEARYEVVDLRARAPVGWPAPEVVLVNPPRRGLDGPILEALGRSPARAVIYMSCGPESFGRDLEVLARAGWRLAQVEAHDMLPQTAHVELLGVLRR